MPWEETSKIPREDESANKVSDQELLSDALRRAPENAYIFYITYPSKPNESRQVRVQVGHDPYPFGIIYRYYYDQYSGELLGTTDPALTPAPDVFLDKWTDPLHFGTWGGISVRILYMIVALVPLLLAITGWNLWRHRVAKEKESQDRKRQRQNRSKNKSKPKEKRDFKSTEATQKTNVKNGTGASKKEEVVSDSETRQD